MNGITAALSEIGAKLSSTLVAMWTISRTITSSETSRCTVSTANRGQRTADTRSGPRIPMTTLAVRSTSATAPVPRARYQ